MKNFAYFLTYPRVTCQYHLEFFFKTKLNKEQVIYFSQVIIHYLKRAYFYGENKGLFI
jgi:hypothetical protein